MRFRRKLRNVFLITLSEHPEILLEILSSQERKKKFQPEKPLFVVGVARGHQEACHLACSIILEVYQSTGSFQVKEYLYKKHFQDF